MSKSLAEVKPREIILGLGGGVVSIGLMIWVEDDLMMGVVVVVGDNSRSVGLG